ncbi:MAG: twin-arginine translocase subunit TatC [Acidobacteriota bacterium]
MHDSPTEPTEERASNGSIGGGQPQKKSSSDLLSIYDRGDPPAPKSTPFREVREPDENGELGGKMTFLQHLDELRRRILYSIIALAVTFGASFFFHEQIFEFLSAPIHSAVGELVVIKPTEPFTIYLKVSFVAAVFLAIPVILFQTWQFVAPGLYRKEKTYVVPFLFSSTLLFVLGGGFAYYVVLPPALDFLLNVFGSKFKPMITAVEYFNFEMVILLGMGAIFQLPVLVAFLSIFGLVTPGFLWRNFRYAFLLIVIVAAVVSPTTDPLNLLLWSGPMVILYFASIGVSWIFQRRRARQGKS